MSGYVGWHVPIVKILKMLMKQYKEAIHIVSGDFNVDNGVAKPLEAPTQSGAMERCPEGTSQSVALLRPKDKELEADARHITKEDGEEEDTKESCAAKDADGEEEEYGATESSRRGQTAGEDKEKTARYASTEAHKGRSE
ncbi:hypothetical protein NDU88_001196 [Pleurodeles waltl]|uniref:Uncharacterized protein n=1 Tax=Pleurodeles waltl TaxID=8319 RepID=A0AAV7THZ8_PLEWA|nr:hypothetical protein NDU88_001196 [Pleurodeles waltl]